MTNRHKVFVSYHHANDQTYRDQFEQLCIRADIAVMRSVQIGDIDVNLKTETIRQKIRDEYLADSTVTVVLIGTQTWQRKHVDWEIGSSIRHTQNNPRSGLLGIFLPNYPLTNNHYDPYTIPPRLYDNVQAKFAQVYGWSTNPLDIQNWIHQAFERRFTINPDNSRESFGENRTGAKWS
ncbi:MAG: TIR domain-containing protein [Alphaproteobacteria bacterium]|nr:TIR domain-containing protein [Alphaproteobacteria bacterium]